MTNSVPMVTFKNNFNSVKHSPKGPTPPRAKVRILYNKLSMSKMGLPLVLRIFGTYILPIIEYLSPIWAFRQKRKDSIDFLNATLTKYLKRYLCILLPTTMN